MSLRSSTFVRTQHTVNCLTVRRIHQGLFEMLLNKVKTLWGVADSHDPAKWDALFRRIKGDGFSFVESISLTLMADPALFVSLLTKHELGLVIQVHTAGGYLENGSYIYCSSCDVDVHLASLRKQLTEALQLGAVLVNCHSGHDSWDTVRASEYFSMALKIEEELLVGAYSGVLVVHETHRQRLLHSPYQTRDILLRPELSKLKINADLSHWVCVCEHVFDASEPRDCWWPEVLELVAAHCHFIHARFGHAEGPQIYDPRTPTVWDAEITAHLLWWQTIWRSQQARGCSVAFVEAEHGPGPYQVWTVPEHSPDSDKNEELWQINNYVIARVDEAFRKK